SLVSSEDLALGTIIPSAMDLRVPPQVAAAVAASASIQKLARRTLDESDVYNNTRDYLYEGILRIL
ncbi:MAG: hypothetical protein J7L96_06095, partial [Bacteroidales bacterium]|nr:hypothetical protein [Bacteroidales bacterium]